jgi:hypothetical protein
VEDRYSRPRCSRWVVGLFVRKREHCTYEIVARWEHNICLRPVAWPREVVEKCFGPASAPLTLCPSIKGASSHRQPFRQGHGNSIGLLDEYAPSCEQAWHTDALSRQLIPVCVTSYNTYWRPWMFHLQRREDVEKYLVAVKELV